MVFIIILAIVFFVLVMVACLKMAGKEDEWLMRQMEEKSIENADVFVYDGEPTILDVDLAKDVIDLTDDDIG